MQKLEAIQDVVTTILGSNTPIYKAQQIKKAVLETTNLEVENYFVRQVMRKELGMGYRLAK